jgi:hypothetical protein
MSNPNFIQPALCSRAIDQDQEGIFGTFIPNELSLGRFSLCSDLSAL